MRNMPETARPASTMKTSWPATHVALTTDITPARTEGFDRIRKNLRRVACNFAQLGELAVADTLKCPAQPSMT